MSKARRKFTIFYLSFILALVLIYYISRFLMSCGDLVTWRDYHGWLGPAPTELESCEIHNAADHSTLALFSFAPDKAKEAYLVNFFEMEPSATPIPNEWQIETAAGVDIYRAKHKRICLLDGTNDWGYVIEEPILTRLNNGRSLLAFNVMHRVPYNSDSLDKWYHPSFEHQQDHIAIIVLLSFCYCLCWMLPVPLGFLLLFPGFTLKSKRQHVIWYSSVVIPQIALFIQAHLCIHDPAIIGAYMLFFFGTPIMLLAARWALPYAQRIAQS